MRQYSRHARHSIRRRSSKFDRPKRLWAKHCARKKRTWEVYHGSPRRNSRDHGRMVRGRRRFRRHSYNVDELLRTARLSASRGRERDAAQARVEELEKLLGRWRRRHQRLAKRVREFIEGVICGGLIKVETRGR